MVIAFICVVNNMGLWQTFNIEPSFMKCVTLTHDRDGLTFLIGILGPDIHVVECTDNSITSIS